MRVVLTFFIFAKINFDLCFFFFFFEIFFFFVCVEKSMRVVLSFLIFVLSAGVVYKTKSRPLVTRVAHGWRIRPAARRRRIIPSRPFG